MSNRSATGKVSLAFSATIQNTMDDSEVAAANLGNTLTQTLTSGVSNNQFDRVWQDKSRALANGVTETLNFNNLAGLDIGAGPGEDALGQALDLQEIVLIVITQVSGTGRLEVNPTVPANNLSWMP